MNIEQLAAKYGVSTEQIAEQGHACERADHLGRPFSVWSEPHGCYIASRRFLVWLRKWNEDQG